MSVSLQHNQRGTYLSADVTAANYTRLANHVGSGLLPNDGARAPFGLHWTFSPNSTLSEDSESCGLMKTFVIPNVAYAANTLTTPVAKLDTLTLGWDDRMEALGCTDAYASVQNGILTACDMNRYTMQVDIYSRSINRGPLTVVPGTGIVPLHSFTIPGDASFGGPVRNNPLVLPVNIDVLPNTAYTVQVRIPGLFDPSGTAENLMVPSLTLGLTGDAPIDGLPDLATIQNLPTSYTQTLNTPTLTPPVAGQPVAADGASGVQTNLNIYEDRVLADNRLYQSAQPGVSSAMDSDGKAEPVQSGALTGWSRHVITVPLWESWPGSVRSSNGVPDLPFVSGALPYRKETGARICIPVPQNFIIDHVFVGMSWISPPAPTLIPIYTGWGQRPTGPDFKFRIGVSIAQHGSAQTDQQVAYGVITPAAPANVVHSNFYTFSSGTVEAETLYEIQTVGISTTPGWSQNGEGPPVYVGRTPTEGQTRTNISPLPASPAGVPTTYGRETHLWITCIMEDLVDGLGDVARPDDVRIGEGGHTVYLIGRVPTVGAAGPAYKGTMPGPGEQGAISSDFGV